MCFDGFASRLEPQVDIILIAFIRREMFWQSNGKVSTSEVLEYSRQLR